MSTREEQRSRIRLTGFSLSGLFFVAAMVFVIVAIWTKDHSVGNREALTAAFLIVCSIAAGVLTDFLTYD